MIRRALFSLALLFLPLAQPALAREKPVATGLVSASDARAAAAGVEMLKAGGSATDAAIAAMLVLNVVEPQNSGLGGGTFLVRHDGKTGTIATLDGREAAPAAADPNWFLGPDGRPISYNAIGAGGRAAGVPGSLAVMASAHKSWGKLPWAKLFAPAIRLAREGSPVSARMHNGADLYGRHVVGWGKESLFPAGDKAVATGSLYKNPQLATLMEAIAKAGPDHFYKGALARKMVDALNTAATSPSKMTLADFAGYQAKERAPICGTYRVYRICGMGPPSAGAISVLMILKQLERFDMAKLGRDNPVSWHLMAESERLAYADRGMYIADPDYVSVPVAGLLDPAYLAQRSALISPDKTLASYAPGLPAGAPPRKAVAFRDDPGTTDLAVVDKDGNVVEATTTVNGYFGNGIAVGGMFLNNEMPDFDILPASQGYFVANRVEGGKRPRSSMAPTIVYGPDGKVRLAIGAAGGATIICQVAKAIIGVLDWGMSAQDAIAMGLVYAPGKGGTLEKGTELEAMMPALQSMGEQLRVEELGLKANAVEQVDGKWVGAADPRSLGTAIGTDGVTLKLQYRSNDLNGAHE